MKLGLNAFWLKIIALITMTIDHYGYFIRPEEPIYRIIGRLSFVLFGYFCANAYIYTSNKKKYFMTLLSLGIIIDLVLIITNNYLFSNI
ncbi:MAG: TraX family protein, partial [Bacilli bacterium]